MQQTETRASESSEAEGYPSVVFRLGDRQFALSAHYVESMVQLPSVTRVPDTPEYVRGVMNLRGRILRVLDLRRRLGLKSLDAEADDFDAMMDARLQDHYRWLDELTASVENGRSFSGQTDPTRCALGRWLSGFSTSDGVLQTMIDRFHVPHKAVHHAAEDVAACMRSGDADGAMRVIAAAKASSVNQLEHLFESTKESYRGSCREIALVLRDGSNRCATVVDQVIAVEHLASVDAKVAKSALASVSSDGLVSSIGKRGKDEQLVFAIEPRIAMDIAVSDALDAD